MSTEVTPPAVSPGCGPPEPSDVASSSTCSEAAGLPGGLSARRIDSPLDVHEVLPEGALAHPAGRLRVLPRSGERLGGALGVEQAGRARRLAEPPACATRAPGSQERAGRTGACEFRAQERLALDTRPAS